MKNWLLLAIVMAVWANNDRSTTRAGKIILVLILSVLVAGRVAYLNNEFTKAEDGGESGEGLWYPAAKGYRPGTENDSMRQYLAGNYVEKR